MRARLMASLGLAALLASACGGEKDADPVASGTTPGALALENAAEPGAADISLSLGCGAPFTRDATPATLAVFFGRENVVPEEVPGPEGVPLNVTAIYPDDPARRIEVIFHNEEERTDLAAVTVTSPSSQWTGPGGLKMGDSVEAVEAANGGPFNLMGFQWDYGGFVSDWKGGKLAEAAGCATNVRLSPASDDLPPEIVGDGVQPASNLQSLRAAEPRVTTFGISWAPPA